MLVLSRRVNESIQIGDDVTVTVLSCKGHHIRIGISAPKELSVHREEVYLRNRRSGAALRAPNEQTTARHPS
jgi:carbon storage regulator